MKIIVTGASGLVGSEVSDFFESVGHHVIRLSGRKSLNLQDTKQVLEFFSEEKPELTIHCAGARDVDYLEQNADEAYLNNTLATKNVALATQASQAKLMFVSSDTVFDGTKESGYHEFDKPNPINIYGKSKLLAEKEVRRFCNKHFILRTALLFGLKGHRENNLIYGLLDKCQQGMIIYASQDQVCNPSFTLDLAKAFLTVAQTEYYGTYHITNTGTASRYDIYKAIVEKAGFDGELVKPIVADQLHVATRAKNTTFKSITFEPTFNIQMRSWDAALEDCLTEILAERNK